MNQPRSDVAATSSSSSSTTNTTTSSSSVTGAIRTESRRKALGAVAKRACDQCKFRKIKCSLSQPCRACVSMGFECTFFQPQKKRGPTGHRVSQIRQQQNNLSLNHPPAQGASNSFPNAFPYHPNSSSRGDQVPQALRTQSWPIPSENPVSIELAPSSATPSIQPGWSTDASESQSNGGICWNERNDVEYWLPDTLDAQLPVFDFPGNNILLKTSLPSIIETHSTSASLQAPTIPSTGATAPKTDIVPPDSHHLQMVWPASIVEANMIPWIDIYFDRLHPTLPVLNRAALFIRMLAHEHRRNPQFGAMLLALCAFSLTQPIEIQERPTSSSRASQARSMMHEATKMRSCSDFGEHPTIEAVLTSFYLFGCLFGSNQHNAAWLRLREALDLAATMGLNNPDSYQDLPSEEKGQRLRTYLVLSITERAYALQRRHPITFWGRPGFSMRPVHDFIHTATHSLVSGIIVHNEKDAEGMMGLARLMELFDAIDEDVVDCWNQQCSIQAGYCEQLTAAKALVIHQNLNRVSESELYKGYNWFESSKLAHGGDQNRPTIGLRETQSADVFITKKWLQNRIWVLCSTHGFLRPVSEHRELCLDFAVTLAQETLDICRALPLSSMEAHGIGLVEKLYDIVVGAISVLYNIQMPLAKGITVPPPAGIIPNMQLPISHMSDGGTSTKSLAGDYLLLLNTLRGGNHPFMDKYKALLSSVHTTNDTWAAQ
ncbi:CeGAL family transcription factor [Aspergillus fijiensis CBS 313.89]|uniref:Putative C6 transcription factor n=1 Tax=Aspergillus fijiensis CBS 313.89 TaxID=1448319 RepID=A0A8G1RVQ7_9EURO|nr:putative C6 transcription factor [Aspergillus fijiensis CBS 313.89]RAK79784.1 putative C6 transcription factor [Aspergillus fijiensis CBS 313.89]